MLSRNLAEGAFRDPLEGGDQGSGGHLREQPHCYPHPLGPLLFLSLEERGPFGSQYVLRTATDCDMGPQ